jgi:hypothetical protein
LEQRADDLDKIIGKARDWQSKFNALREQLADCAQPVQSKSLLRIKHESIYALLRRTRFDDTLDPLVTEAYPIVKTKKSEN